MKYCVEHGLDPNNPRNQKLANYYTDVWIELESKDGGIRKIFIEIKPYAQTQPPKPLPPNPKMKDLKAYNRDAETFLINQAKWKAAKAEFESRGAEFMVLTEVELQKMGIIHL